MRINTLASGSSGNSIFIEGGGSRILIDAGCSGKNIAQSLIKGCAVSPEELDGIVVTHAHRDHICGVGVLSRRFDLPIYATQGTWSEMERLIGSIRPENICLLERKGDFALRGMRIQTFPTSHDALDSVGLVCSSGAESVGIATDTGVFTPEMADMLNNLSCLILESNHDRKMLSAGPYPRHLKQRIASATGHMCNEVCARALLKIMGSRTRHIILAHLSAENNLPRLALQTVRSILEAEQVCLEGISLQTAPRYIPGQCICLGDA